MKMASILFSILLLLNGCAGQRKNHDSNLVEINANKLCQEYTLSQYRASEYKSQTIVGELNRRGISIATCSETDFAKYLRQNITVIYPSRSPISDDSNDREISRLKKEIKSLRSKTSELETKMMLESMQRNIESNQKLKFR